MFRTSSTLLLVFAIAATCCVFFVAYAEKNADADVFVLDTPSDLPPLPRHVLKWTVDDVQRWMTITIGYPEFVPHVRAFLIDGPTLLSLNVERIFSQPPQQQQQQHVKVHPAQIAKLKAHQQILRGQCVCGGLSGGGSSSSVTLSTYLQNAGGSTLWHLALAAFGPRWGFISLLFTSPELMCCVFGGESVVAPSDASVLEELERQYVVTSEKNGGDKKQQIKTDTIYPCGMESSSATEFMCSRAPSWPVTVFAMLTPFGLFFFLGVNAFTTHWFLASVWLIACAVMQVIEILSAVEFVQNIRANGFSVKEFLEETFGDFKNPLMLLVPAGLVIGRYGPLWMSWLFVVGLTLLVGGLVARILLNLIVTFFGGPRHQSDEQQQPPPQQQQ